MLVSRCCKDLIYMYYTEEGQYYYCGKCDIDCDTINLNIAYMDFTNAEIQPGFI